MTGPSLTLNLRAWIDLARREIVPIAFFLAITLLMLGFVEITDEVTEGEGEVRWFDEGVLYALRTSDSADPIGPRWLEETVTEITALGGFGVLALAVVGLVGVIAVSRRLRSNNNKADQQEFPKNE